MMKHSMRLMVVAALAAATAIVHHATAQEATAPESTASTAPTESAGSAADATMQDLKNRREKNPMIEPIVKPNSGNGASGGDTAAAGTGLVGPGPGAKPKPLRREGEFLIERRGRLIREPRTGPMTFQFDADQRSSPEIPMVLLPCRLLENMEELVSERGDRIVFKLTGQVFVYRGANYVLPTLFTLAIDKGNLQR